MGNIISNEKLFDFFSLFAYVWGCDDNMNVVSYYVNPKSTCQCSNELLPLTWISFSVFTSRKPLLLLLFFLHRFNSSSHILFDKYSIPYWAHNVFCCNYVLLKHFTRFKWNEKKTTTDKNSMYLFSHRYDPIRTRMINQTSINIKHSMRSKIRKWTFNYFDAIKYALTFVYRSNSIREFVKIIIATPNGVVVVKCCDFKAATWAEPQFLFTHWIKHTQHVIRIQDNRKCHENQMCGRCDQQTAFISI